MAASEVEIVNSALIKLGERTIASLDDNRKAARKAKVQYPRQRKKLLRSYRWNFAVTRSPVLGAALPAPLYGFTSRFLMPVDCLRVLGLHDENEPQENYTSSTIPFKVEGRHIYTDETALKLFYIADVTDVSKFDPMFEEVLAISLAIDLAYDLSAGFDHPRNLKVELQQAIKDARNSNAIEGTPEIIVIDDWIASRFSNRRLREGPVF